MRGYPRMPSLLGSLNPAMIAYGDNAAYIPDIMYIFVRIVNFIAIEGQEVFSRSWASQFSEIKN